MASAAASFSLASRRRSGGVCICIIIITRSCVRFDDDDDDAKSKNKSPLCALSLSISISLGPPQRLFMGRVGVGGGGSENKRRNQMMPNSVSVCAVLCDLYFNLYIYLCYRTNYMVLTTMIIMSSVIMIVKKHRSTS